MSMLYELRSISDPMSMLQWKWACSYDPMSMLQCLCSYDPMSMLHFGMPCSPAPEAKKLHECLRLKLHIVFFLYSDRRLAFVAPTNHEGHKFPRSAGLRCYPGHGGEDRKKTSQRW
jgi:hypothetical protein